MLHYAVNILVLLLFPRGMSPRTTTAQRLEQQCWLSLAPARRLDQNKADQAIPSPASRSSGRRISLSLPPNPQSFEKTPSLCSLSRAAWIRDSVRQRLPVVTQHAHGLVLLLGQRPPEQHGIQSSPQTKDCNQKWEKPFTHTHSATLIIIAT